MNELNVYNHHAPTCSRFTFEEWQELKAFSSGCELTKSVMRILCRAISNVEFLSIDDIRKRAYDLYELHETLGI